MPSSLHSPSEGGTPLAPETPGLRRNPPGPLRPSLALPQSGGAAADLVLSAGEPWDKVLLRGRGRRSQERSWLTSGPPSLQPAGPAGLGPAPGGDTRAAGSQLLPAWGEQSDRACPSSAVQGEAGQGGSTWASSSRSHARWPSLSCHG